MDGSDDEGTCSKEIPTTYGSLLDSGRKQPFHVIRRVRMPLKDKIEDDGLDYELYYLTKNGEHETGVVDYVVCYREVSKEPIPEEWIPSVMIPIKGRMTVISIGKEMVKGVNGPIDTKKKALWIKAVLNK